MIAVLQIQYQLIKLKYAKTGIYININIGVTTSHALYETITFYIWLGFCIFSHVNSAFFSLPNVLTSVPIFVLIAQEKKVFSAIQDFFCSLYFHLSLPISPFF